jgi:hypothetical protein
MQLSAAPCQLFPLEISICHSTFFSNSLILRSSFIDRPSCTNGTKNSNFVNFNIYLFTLKAGTPKRFWTDCRLAIPERTSAVSVVTILPEREDAPNADAILSSCPMSPPIFLLR